MRSDLVLADTDGLYYFRDETELVEEPDLNGTKVVSPKRGAIPRDSFGRALDEPTIDDENLSYYGPNNTRC